MFYEISQFYDYHIEVRLCEKVAQKTFIFSRKPYSLSVIFVRL